MTNKEDDSSNNIKNYFNRFRLLRGMFSTVSEGELLNVSRGKENVSVVSECFSSVRGSVLEVLSLNAFQWCLQEHFTIV